MGTPRGTKGARIVEEGTYPSRSRGLWSRALRTERTLTRASPLARLVLAGVRAWRSTSKGHGRCLGRLKKYESKIKEGPKKLGLSKREHTPAAAAAYGQGL